MKHLSKLLVLLLTLSIILCGCNTSNVTDIITTTESTEIITEAPTDTSSDTEPESTVQSTDASSTEEPSESESEASSEFTTVESTTEEDTNVEVTTEETTTEKITTVEVTTEEITTEEITTEEATTEKVTASEVTDIDTTTEETTTEEITTEEVTTEEVTTEEVTTEEVTTEEVTTNGIGTVPTINEEDDPYENIDKAEFYANYTPATSYEDSYFRTQNKLMSGSIALQDQAPTVSEYRPKYNGCYIKNTEPYFTDGGYTYNVVNAYGEVVFQIYKGGAYVTLEEVAAYVFAFGDVPANYSANKKESPKSNPWGEYLRVNHTKFSGNTSKYPYEPELPDISGCGGSLQYYEIDIGTTGTDCDPSYTPALYNNGSKIVRGAARIVYARFDKNGNNIIEFDEKYVFYTYNHYNDFQEYLNYEGGWGDIFGNVTGGGTISSKYNYNPTPYIVTVGMPLPKESAVYVVTYYYIDKEALMESLFV